MKHYKTIIAAVAAGLACTAATSQATLSVAGSGVGLFAANTGSGAPFISVGYDVVFDSSVAGGLYTYLYQFTPLAGNPITDFTVNASFVQSVLPGGTSIAAFAGFLGSSGITLTSTSIGGLVANPSLVDWNYVSNGGQTTTTSLVGFTSKFGPAFGTGSLNDGGAPGPWSDNPSAGGSSGTPILVPVPEASTVVAGALMLLPFGIGAIRSLRKDRTA